MPGGKEKFGLDFHVTRETEVGFFGFEELREVRRSMHTMAIIAGHGPQFVCSSLELKKLLIFLVALETNI